MTGANRGIGRAIAEALVVRDDVQVTAAARTAAAALALTARCSVHEKTRLQRMQARLR